MQFKSWVESVDHVKSNTTVNDQWIPQLHETVLSHVGIRT